MSTTAHQTWVRRAGRYFTDSIDRHTHRVSPVLGTPYWEVHRNRYGTSEWTRIGMFPTLAQAKRAALSDNP